MAGVLLVVIQVTGLSVLLLLIKQYLAKKTGKDGEFTPFNLSERIIRE